MLVDIGVASYFLKKGKWEISLLPSKKANSTPKEQSGTIEKRKRKAQGKRQDDHTEVC